MHLQVIAVALLSYIALGDKINPRDRSPYVAVNNETGATWISEPYWNEKLLPVCIDLCNKTCTNCTEPEKCDEATQRKCGEKQVDLLNHLCSPEDKCIPKECECKLDYSKHPIFFKRM